VKVRTDKEDNYKWERENAEAWITRKVDVSITDAGEQLGVKTIIINPPLICVSPIQHILAVFYRSANVNRWPRNRPRQSKVNTDTCTNRCLSS
jgi:hypothetical protein